MRPEAKLAGTLIRDARPEDVDALVALSRKTFRDKFGHIYRPEDLNAYLEQAHTPDFYGAAILDPDYLVRVAAAEDGRLGAYLVCCPLELPADAPAPGAVELMRVYVDAPLQGRKLGTAFVEESFAWARECEAPEIYLSVFSENDRARRLYERFGFEKVGEFWFPVGEHRDREFLMKMSLTA